MSAKPTYSSNLATHAGKLMLHAVIYSAFVVAVFLGVGWGLPRSGSLQPALALLPGISLGGFLVILSFYFKHYDEMLKSLMTRSLTASALVGFILMLGSMVRADTTEFGQIDDAVVVSMMAIAFIVSALTMKWRHR